MNKQIKLFFMVILMTFIVSLSVVAIDIKSELGLSLETGFTLQPTYNLTATIKKPNLRLRLQKGFIEWNSAYNPFIEPIPSQAVSADLLIAGYDFDFSLLGFDFRYEKFLSNLGEHRHLVAHRVKAEREGYPLYLDFYETSVVVGKGKELYYMYNHIPFLPVYLVQHIGLKMKEIKNQDINALMGFNLGYRLPNNALLFADVIVDDFPAIPWIDVQLPVMGVTLGYNSKTLESENKGYFQHGLALTANTRYLHAHWGGVARYINDKEFLGDDLGPDAFRTLYTLNYNRLSVNGGLSLSYELHGPGHLDEYWVAIGREEAYKVFFLSEIVEQKLGLRLSFKNSLGNNIYYNSTLEYKRVFPKDDKAFNRFQGRVGLSYVF